MERDFRAYQIQKCIKYIFLIKLLIEYYIVVLKTRPLYKTKLMWGKIWYADAIQIHKFTLSHGCLMIDKERWEEFWRILDLGKKERVKIIVDTEKNE